VLCAKTEMNLRPILLYLNDLDAILEIYRYSKMSLMTNLLSLLFKQSTSKPRRHTHGQEGGTSPLAPRKNCKVFLCCKCCLKSQ